MPCLERPHSRRAITLPSRTAQVIAESDILVVGGGPAGIGAALAASDAGMEVILVERYGFLGGNATVWEGIHDAGYKMQDAG